MATISQSGVNSFMSAANNGAEEISRSIEGNVKKFANDVGAIWGAPLATEFASQFSDSMKKLSNNLRSNMNTFHVNLQNGVNAYNEMNKSSVALNSVQYTDSLIDTSGIHDYLPGSNGNDVQGIVEGASDSVISALDTAIENIISTTNQVTGKMESSGAFDMDETASDAAMFKSLGNILKNGQEAIKDSAKKYIQDTINQYGEIKSANVKRANEVANSGNGSGNIDVSM